MSASTDGDIAPLLYIAASRIPGRAANSFQVMKMAEALCALAPRTTLVAQRGDGLPADGAALRRLYGVGRIPALHLLGAQGRFGIHLFNLRAAFIAGRMGAGLVLSRSIGAAAWTARLGLPTVFECHAPPQGAERLYWRWLMRARAFRRLVVISHGLKRILAERHPEVSALDVVVAPDGVDLARFDGLPSAADAKRAAGRDPARPVAGYAGHLYAGRGIELILDIASRLPNWDFVLAGGEPDAVAATGAAVRKRGLANVALWGFVANAALPRRLAIADVLLMPYQRSVRVSGGTLDTAQWMSPLKMFEYMAMGRAIVASDLAVLREVLDEEIAVLAAPDRADQWVAALRLLERSDARARLANAAHRRASRYDWRARISRMLDGLVPAAAGPMSGSRREGSDLARSAAPDNPSSA